MMRTTVRSVAAAPGTGSVCPKSSIIAAFAQMGSVKSPSIIGACDVSILGTSTVGLVPARPTGWAKDGDAGQRPINVTSATSFSLSEQYLYNKKILAYVDALLHDIRKCSKW